MLTRHEVGSFIIMTTAMWLWFSHSGSAGTDCRGERARREEGLQSGRLAGQQNFFPAPFGFLLVCSSAPPPLFWSFLARGWDSLSLGRGNLICSLLPPPVPVAILPSPSEGEFVHCREKKERRSNEIILFADRMSVKISERLCIQSDHSVSLRTVRIQ